MRPIKSLNSPASSGLCRGRKVVIAALYRRVAAPNSASTWDRRARTTSFTAAPPRLDISVLEDPATALREILLEKGCRDAEMPPDANASNCHRHQGWIREAHADAP